MGAGGSDFAKTGRVHLLSKAPFSFDQGEDHPGAKETSSRTKGVGKNLIRGGILNPHLNRILAETGHTDILTICDRGFPVPKGPERLDLALVDDIPTVLDVLFAIEKQFVIDRIIIAEEMEQVSPERMAVIKKELPQIKMETVSHLRFKEICSESRAVIRTGDTVPYANLMIVSG